MTRFRRRLVLLAAAVAIGQGALRVAKEARETLAAPPTPAEQRAFLAECVAAVPPGDWIHLASGASPFLASGDLYPRKVRVVPADRLPELKRSSPDAWVVSVPAPFDRARAFLGRARDLP